VRWPWNKRRLKRGRSAQQATPERRRQAHVVPRRTSAHSARKRTEMTDATDPDEPYRLKGWESVAVEIVAAMTRSKSQGANIDAMLKALQDK